MVWQKGSVAADSYLVYESDIVVQQNRCVIHAAAVDVAVCLCMRPAVYTMLGTLFRILWVELEA